MGAVKTNRLGIVDDAKYQKYAKKEIQYYQQQYAEIETNNRRKMAGLPLIRRAKS
jgi:hypothetical protein